MDLVLHYADEWFFTPYVYPESWKLDDIYRQAINLFIIVIVSADTIYLGLATLNYFLLFDPKLKEHPHFLKNQVSLEITHGLTSIPVMSVMTTPLFLLEVRGYGGLYDEFENSFNDWMKLIGSVISIFLFTDMAIYWIHRLLHYKWVYKYIHKPHHQWKVSTPFASHAMHPVDAFSQALPWHIYVFLFPIHKVVWLVLFFLLNMWAVSIHDGEFQVPDKLVPVINGAANHTIHHLYFDYNYGQYTTLWDRIGGTYKAASHATHMKNTNRSKIDKTN